MSRTLLFINGAALLGCAFFDFNTLNIEWLSGFDIKTSLMLFLLLALPFVDKNWRWEEGARYPYRVQLWLLTSVLLVLITVMHPSGLKLLLSTVLLVALPEEWFFRAYFMRRLESIVASNLNANVITSLLFAVLHMPSQGWFGLSVFMPSLVFGWLYQRNRDLMLVVLLHALSNSIFLYFYHYVID